MNPSRDYLVTLMVNGKSQKTIWNPSHPMPIGYPAHWMLEKTKGGISLRARYWPRKKSSILLNSDSIDKGAIFAIPTLEDVRKNSNVYFSLRKIPYKGLLESEIPKTTDLPFDLELYLFYGVKKYFLHYSRIENHVTVSVKGKNIFDIEKRDKNYFVKTYRYPIQWVDDLGKSWGIDVNTEFKVNLNAAPGGYIRFEKNWWQFKLFPIPKRYLIDSGPIGVPEDILQLRRIATGVFSFIFLFLALGSFYKPEPKVEKIKIVSQANIQLKEPKVIKQFEKKEPKKIEIKKVAEAKKIEKIKIEKPKVEKPKIEKPKVVKVQPQKAPPKVAKAPQPALKIQPAPKPSATAQLSKSLNFLSAAPAKVSKGAQAFKSESPRFENAASNFKVAQNNELSKLKEEAGTGEPIRSLSSKSLNEKDINRVAGSGDVKAKVSKNAVLNGGEVSMDTGGSELNIQGDGSIDQNNLAKVLEKALPKFQYCYEKALWSNPSLAGTVQMEWLITPSGQAQKPQVLRSQMESKMLFDCMKKELMNLAFPKPSGGTVQVEYTFSFTSSKF
jgi:outer membrane biosynthesis protein TonB